MERLGDEWTCPSLKIFFALIICPSWLVGEIDALVSSVISPIPYGFYISIIIPKTNSFSLSFLESWIFYAVEAKTWVDEHFSTVGSLSGAGDMSDLKMALLLTRILIHVVSSPLLTVALPPFH